MTGPVDHINSLTRRVPVWLVWLILVMPAVWFFYLGLTGGLGADPVKTLEHKLGKIALQVLVVVLAITPLRRLAGLNLLKFRRALGLLVFFYVCLHLSVWLFLDVGLVAQVWADILKRPYVTLGFGAFVLMMPLALTSNTASVRRLGAGWRRLHRLTYPAAVLAALHYVWLVKGIQIEPLIYLGAILGLLALRLRLPRRGMARALRR